MCRLDPPPFPTPLARPHSQTNARGILRHTHTVFSHAFPPPPLLSIPMLVYYTPDTLECTYGPHPSSIAFLCVHQTGSRCSCCAKPTLPFFLFFFYMYFSLLSIEKKNRSLHHLPTAATSPIRGSCYQRRPDLHNNCQTISTGSRFTFSRLQVPIELLDRTKKERNVEYVGRNRLNLSVTTGKRGFFICFLKGSSSDNDGDAVDARGCDTHTYTHTSVSLPSTPQAVPIGREKSYETGGGRETTTKMLNTPHWSPLATGSRNRFVSCMYHVPVRYA